MTERLTTGVWQEFAEPDDPFSAERCYCSGYDVYGELIQKAGWLEYLYLLFQGRRPSQGELKVLNGIAVAIANPGPREYSVQAAMSAGAGGAGSGASLMAAMSVGAGNLGGAREVFHMMQAWSQLGNTLSQWQEYLSDCSTATNSNTQDDVWPAMEHPAGFAPYGKSCTTPVKQTLEHLTRYGIGEHLIWLQQHRNTLEDEAGMPLAMSGVTAAAMLDLAFDAEQGEMLTLLLRLPGAAAHALEQRERGWRDFPFHNQGVSVTNDPKSTAATHVKEEVDDE